MNKKKFYATVFTAIFSTSLLFGCTTGQDEQEPDPTEEPSEQQEQQEQQD
ncbi:hypothetical protein [Oceanobacillus iheyensis HTE831]|uniref:Uncharacterized protein n=1 Tax=Oceanobacillus iheyensis (strain DSM 14371 / CIP 107618 / JCM 11309 / KCTC 3954 / HTE831) TaxID=221109 RepID=Q8ELC7_OCEIH|nr:hypothetical protein [Oceanobacillus iheyensis]BAC15258.1 hypothetical protein [Oceanobacillus iheyensis HTE831]